MDRKSCTGLTVEEIDTFFIGGNPSAQSIFQSRKFQPDNNQYVIGSLL